MKLYASLCQECGCTVSYSLSPEVQQEALCHDCTESFVQVSNAMGLSVQDENNDDITHSTMIVRRVIKAVWHWEWRVRTHINQWRLEYAVDKAIAKRDNML